MMPNESDNQLKIMCLLFNSICVFFYALEPKSTTFKNSSIFKNETKFAFVFLFISIEKLTAKDLLNGTGF